jgi:ankyrin repeat protein
MFQQSKNRLFVLLAFFAWSNLALGGDIFDAAKNGDLEQAKLLLESNPGLVFSNNSDAGFTPLHWAVRRNHLEMVKLLLANKANIDAPDQYGRTSLYFATYADNKGITELLLHSNACVRCKEGPSPFLCAINNHDFEMMQLFLAYKADIDTRN